MNISTISSLQPNELASDGAIPGAVNIPLGQVAEVLPLPHEQCLCCLSLASVIVQVLISCPLSNCQGVPLARSLCPSFLCLCPFTSESPHQSNCPRCSPCLLKNGSLSLAGPLLKPTLPLSSLAWRASEVIKHRFCQILRSKTLSSAATCMLK